MIYTLVMDGQETIITFDAVTEFTETQSASIPTYPVESGFPINDNLVLNSPTFSLSAIMTSYRNGEREVALVDGEFVLLDGGATNVKSEIDFERELRNIMLQKKFFDVYVSKDLFDPVGSVKNVIQNCVFENLSFPYSSGRSGAIFPKMTIRQINFVVVEESDVLNAKPEIVPINKVATKEQVAQAASTTNSLPNSKAGDKETVENALKGDPRAQQVVAKLDGQIESNLNELQKVRELTKSIQSGNLADANKDVVPNNGRWYISD